MLFVWWGRGHKHLTIRKPDIIVRPPHLQLFRRKIAIINISPGEFPPGFHTSEPHEHSRKYKELGPTVPGHPSSFRANSRLVEGKQRRRAPNLPAQAPQQVSARNHAISDASNAATTLMSVGAPCICPGEKQGLAWPSSK